MIIDIDMTQGFHTLHITEDSVIELKNVKPGRTACIKVQGDAGCLSFPPNWTFIGPNLKCNQAMVLGADELALLSITTYDDGTVMANVAKTDCPTVGHSSDGVTRTPEDAC